MEKAKETGDGGRKGFHDLGLEWLRLHTFMLFQLAWYVAGGSLRTSEQKWKQASTVDRET